MKTESEIRMKIEELELGIKIADFEKRETIKKWIYALNWVLN